MSGGVRLRLGPLPRSEPVRLTITLQAEVKALLDRYAEFHGQLHGERVDAVALIPHMLAAFVARDRGFRSMVAKQAAHRPKAPAA